MLATGPHRRACIGVLLGVAPFTRCEAKYVSAAAMINAAITKKLDSLDCRESNMPPLPWASYAA